jgi:hypothetical protein
VGTPITLYSEEAEGLKLGPGNPVDSQSIPGELIVFERGFATIDPDDFPDLDRWINATGTPRIRVLGADETTSAAEGGHVCPIDGRSFKTEFALNGHLRSHK